jgi:hypothetical protein
MTRLSGGCQCGAVRFVVEGAGLRTTSICHCRMCQKAFGAFYAPLVSVGPAALTWTRGKRAMFRSSNHVQRGFCAACGTPLSYEPDEDWPALAIGAFDHPDAIVPTIQYGTEAKLPYADGLPGPPERPTESTVGETSFVADIVSFQHPDRDTLSWPAEKE